MKTIFLLPPSEGKNSEGQNNPEKLTFTFTKPTKIAINATQKDLKCTGTRYKQGIQLNQNISKSTTTNAIFRYSGVMYNAINYTNMKNNGKTFFENNFLILSGMYGILKPLDQIGNYKLPIDTKGLYQFRQNQIAKTISQIKPDYIINLLPISYAKLIGLGNTNKKQNPKLDIILQNNTKIININFLKSDGKKISHGVKKIKGNRIKNICENNIFDYHKFGGKIINNGKIIDINIITSK